jgi:hypothetical protein
MTAISLKISRDLHLRLIDVQSHQVLPYYSALYNCQYQWQWWELSSQVTELSLSEVRTYCPSIWDVGFTLRMYYHFDHTTLYSVWDLATEMCFPLNSFNTTSDAVSIPLNLFFLTCHLTLSWGYTIAFPISRYDIPVSIKEFMGFEFNSGLDPFFSSSNLIDWDSIPCWL